MSTINLCFQISINEPQLLNDNEYDYTDSFAEFDKQYECYLKKIINFLYLRPAIPFAIAFSGRIMEWISKNNKAFLVLLSEMASRKQIEIMGDAFYHTFLPALLPVDRVGQIELMTTRLRLYTGKRPRGMILPNNAWDASLITSLKTCFMEYLVVDSNFIPQDKTPFLPYIVQDQGKYIYVIGSQEELLTDCINNNCSPEEFLVKLSDAVKDKCPDASRPIVYTSLTPKQMSSLIDSGWLENLDFVLQTPQFNSNFIWNLPTKYIKETQHFQRTYIPSGVYSNKDKKIFNLYDFFLQEPNTYILYAKMMYISKLVNQSRNDKNRKKTARELLWEAQNGVAYLPLVKKRICSNLIKQNAYHCLIQVEKTVREYANFFESVTSFDYDADGIKEYICQFEPFNAYIQARGGSIFEFDVLSVAHNYADNQQGHTGLFLDYLMDFNNPQKNEIFTRQLYKEVSFDSKRHEIRLMATGCFGEMNQAVTLCKNYYITSNGIQIQYIIKNESPFLLKQIFSIESNILLTTTETDELKTEVISGELKELQVEDGESYTGEHKDVSLVRFSDKELSFVYELNENANLDFSTSDGKLASTLSWLVEIPPKRE